MPRAGHLLGCLQWTSGSCAEQVARAAGGPGRMEEERMVGRELLIWCWKRPD